MGCTVTALSPLMLVGDRDGGPSAHTNDYDELWFLQTAGLSWERADQVGKLGWEPQGDTRPGFRRPSRMGRGARPTARRRGCRSTSTFASGSTCARRPKPTPRRCAAPLLRGRSHPIRTAPERDPAPTL